VAQPRLHHSTRHTAFCRANRRSEANDPARGYFRSPLLLIETGVLGWGTDRTRLLAARASDRNKQGERGAQGESVHGGHDMCPRRAAVNLP